MLRARCWLVLALFGHVLSMPSVAHAQEEPLPPPDSPAQPTTPSASPASALPQSTQTTALQTGPSSESSWWGKILPPPPLTLIPLESGGLDSHLELQLAYTHISDLFVKGVNADHVIMALDGQWAFFDRIEIGLNIPFLRHYAASYGSKSGSETEFGNISLNLKGKIYGDSSGPFALSAFINTTFPSGSGTGSSHDFAILHTGAAVSGALSIVTLGADLGTLWFINGDGKDADYFLFDIFTGVQIHTLIAAYLAFQIGVPVYPDVSDVGFSLCPGLRFTPYMGLYFDLAARIAATDNARAVYTLLGRADLIFGAGYRF